MSSHATSTSLAIAASVSLVVSAASAGIVTVQYVGPDNGLWNTAANWSPATVPNDNLGGGPFEAIIDPVLPRTVVMNGSIALTGLSIAGGSAVAVSNGLTLDYLGGSIFNSGELRIATVGTSTQLRLNASELQLVPIDGEGELRLSGGGAARVVGVGANRRLVNEPGHAIRGAGSLGANILLLLTNNGVIEADVVGGTLTIDLVGTNADNFNANRIAATGGTLTITGTSLDNTGGDIVAESGAVIIAGTTLIVGGQLRADGGSVTLTGSTTLIDISTSGVLSVPNGQTCSFQGSFVNNGDLRLESVGTTTSMNLNSDLPITGSGTITMSPFGANRIVGIGGLRLLTLGDMQEIRGGGSLGANINLSLLNNGTVTANETSPMTIDLVGTSANNINNGLLRAVDGATLNITGTLLDNTMGTIRAETASKVVINSSTIERGTIESLGGSLGVELVAGSGLVDPFLAAEIRVPNGSALTITGDVENLGTITLDSVGTNTQLGLNSDSTFGGSGVIVGKASASRIIGLGAVRRLTNDQNHLIRGVGGIGENINLLLTNKGMVQADVAGQTLTIDLAGAVADNVNDGTLRAENGATLRINAPGIDNSFGEIVADGGNVLLSAADIKGGLLSSSSGGEFQVPSSARLIDLELDGTLRLTNGGLLNLSGTIVNNGSILVQSVGTTTQLALDSDVTIAGAGAIEFSSVTANRIVGTGTLRHLTLDVDQTLRGSGNIGANINLDLTNKGSIVADGTALLTIDVANDFQNLGLVEALVSNITIAPGLFTNLGSVIVRPGRTITRNGVYAQSGGITLVDGVLSTTSLSLAGGVLTGNGTVSGPITNSGGVVAPGASAGVLTLTSPYSQGASGTLAVEVTGPLPGNTDRLAVTGTATLAGTLNVTLAGSFNPLPTDEFTILTCTNRIGTFDVALSCEPVEVIYTANEVRVRFPTATGVFGDLNGDGLVDGADLGILLASFGDCPPECCPADLNNDGEVNGADLGILLGQWT